MNIRYSISYCEPLQRSSIQIFHVYIYFKRMQYYTTGNLAAEHGLPVFSPATPPTSGPTHQDCTHLRKTSRLTWHSCRPHYLSLPISVSFNIYSPTNIRYTCRENPNTLYRTGSLDVVGVNNMVKKIGWIGASLRVNDIRPNKNLKICNISNKYIFTIISLCNDLTHTTSG